MSSIQGVNFDAMDSMADWAQGQLTEGELLAAVDAKKSYLFHACTGNCHQGRRCNCAPEAAASATEIGAEDQSQSADADVGLFLVGFISAIALICWTVWACFQMVAAYGL